MKKKPASKSRPKSRRPAPKKKSIARQGARRNSGGTEYAVHGVNAIGSKHGWEINDVYPSRSSVTLHGVTNSDVFRALKAEDLLTSGSTAAKMYIEDEGDQIFVHRKSDGKPIFELRKKALRNSWRDEESDDDESEPDEEEDDFDLREELREGVAIQDQRGGGYTAHSSGREIASKKTWKAILIAVNKWMKAGGYYPNVFYVNERGNTDLLSIPSGKTIRSWV